LVSAALAAIPRPGSAQAGAAASAQPSDAAKTLPGTPRLTRAPATEIEAILENRFERLTAAQFKSLDPHSSPE